MKFTIFTAEKKICIMHGQVFVMMYVVIASEWIQYDFGTSVIVSTIEIFYTDGGEKGYLTPKHLNA